MTDVDTINLFLTECVKTHGMKYRARAAKGGLMWLINFASKTDSNFEWFINSGLYDKQRNALIATRNLLKTGVLRNRLDF